MLPDRPKQVNLYQLWAVQITNTAAAKAIKAIRQVVSFLFTGNPQLGAHLLKWLNCPDRLYFYPTDFILSYQIKTYQPDSRSAVAVILWTLKSVPLNSSSALRRMPTSFFNTPYTA